MSAKGRSGTPTKDRLGNGAGRVSNFGLPKRPRRRRKSDALDALLLIVMRMVYEKWPDNLGYHAGMAMGQLLHERQSQESWHPGEWRSFDTDGYKFSIKVNGPGDIQINRAP